MLAFPIRRGRQIVATPVIKQFRHFLLAGHQDRGQFFVVTGHAGAGKTTASGYICNEVNQAFEGAADSPDAFAAKRFEVTDHRRGRGHIMGTRLLAEFAEKVVGYKVPTDIRIVDHATLADVIIRGMVFHRIEMVFIDEAGRVPLEGIERLAMLLNKAAEEYEHRLTIVLVGMHDLPITMATLPQIARRVTHTMMFGACDREVLRNVLEGMDPQFLFACSEREREEALQFLMTEEVSKGGLLGYVIPVVEHARTIASSNGEPLALVHLRMAHALRAAGKAQSIEAAKRNWVGGTK